MRRVLLRGATLLDPSQKLEKTAHLILEDGRISAIADPAQRPSDLSPSASSSTFDETYDCAGLTIVPGLIDVHTHLRDPGFPEKETIASGAAAAAAGGFTTLFCMPNTNPVHDSPEITRLIKSKASPVRIFPIGAITEGEKGACLADLDGMEKEGIVAISDDGFGVKDASLMYQACKWAAAKGIPVISHCEDRGLSFGPLHEGVLSRKLKIKGAPALSEEVQVARDILIAEATGAPLHIAHVSSEGSVRLIRDAKERGIKVSAEVTPHHLLLADEDLLDVPLASLGQFRVSPPLRSGRDRAALRQGLKEGIIDCIATDHAPHTEREKNCPVSDAMPGFVGLETALSLTLKLVEEGLLSLSQLIAKWTINPSSIFPLSRPFGTLRTGTPADLTVIDLKQKYTIDPAAFLSKSRNTPFSGVEVCGKVMLTFVEGRLVYSIGRNAR